MKNSKPAFWLFSNMELCFKKYHKLDLNNSHYNTLLIVSVFCVSVTACTKKNKHIEVPLVDNSETVFHVLRGKS